jgi:hypothetical protein
MYMHDWLLALDITAGITLAMLTCRAWGEELSDMITATVLGFSTKFLYLTVITLFVFAWIIAVIYLNR